MGNGLGRLAVSCFVGAHRHGAATVTWDPCDEGLGHSFRYVRPDAADVEGSASFRSISGVAVSANASTALSTALLDAAGSTAASAFESSTSFSFVALHPVPRFASPADKGFDSGPLERGFLSGPLDHRASLFSAPLEKPSSFSGHLWRAHSRGRSARSLFRLLSKVIPTSESNAAPVKGLKDSALVGAVEPDSQKSSDCNLQWAQGKAGEDRVHVVVSDDHDWLFVGIYDGFNGPDATDYLLSNLYSAVHRELKVLLPEDREDSLSHDRINDLLAPAPADRLNRGRHSRSKTRGAGWKWEEHRRRSRREFERERSELDERLKHENGRSSTVHHSRVLKALYRALRSTEESFLDIADKLVPENPELALMGSCVLVMLMNGDDVYLMNVGDSRAILARKAGQGKAGQDLESINEEALFDQMPSLSALQLTSDHTTSVAKEVQRIKDEHSDDASAISNQRVKGSLKVTRAFGAGFLKQPKWNDALLEMFRINYVGTSPYITCMPFLYHHKLDPKDKFLILSSDGLHQYFTNEEAVARVEAFLATTPDGDPAQHLVEEVLCRAAKEAGMDFHELLEIPQGDRRRYHDDISIVVISLEGRVWRSYV
ncbi:probable protein phosphatase 2C 4 [Zingiber officinale]|uniref:probable protein phosphatase 2C 4 n=1 Tax=Zingiber officinale TaxID=94328 RepID=UPI001C4B2BC1|nr:probable protein phosphatase 2C 4 [Zingiber officinale]